MAVTDRARVVVLGYVVGFPLGGMTWHSLQYVQGLADLGHDVWLIEDSDDHETAYDPSTGTVGTDPTYGLRYAQRVLDRVGLGARWAYHDAHQARWHGPAAGQAETICRSADVVLNVAGIHPLRPWLRPVPRRVLIDTDPVFTQVRHLTDPDAARHAADHTHFLSFGEAIGQTGCRVPDDGLPWVATRQPVHLPSWPVAPVDPAAPFTTVMQWDSYPSVRWEGTEFGMKSAAFGPFEQLPADTAAGFELAIGRADRATRDRLRAAGWRLRDPQRVTRDPWTYQRYLRASAGEWSVAKHGYVTARTGWFSERSAGYLASGRPVVVQDTGFAHDQLPVGEGLLAFDDLEGARGGIEQVRARPAVHQHAAREIAREHFASDRVLPRLLDAVTGAPSAGGAAGCGGGTVRR